MPIPRNQRLIVIISFQENFFRNFGSIIIFAFFGTFISAVGVGYVTYPLLMCPKSLSPAEQSPRLYILVSRTGIARSYTPRVFDVWFDFIGHGPCHYPCHFQSVQGGPETVHCHLWGEFVERCREYRYVRVSIPAICQGIL